MSDLRAIMQDIHAQRKRLTPAVVEEEARPVDHPLHHRFEWNDNVAGYQYRLIQAARLIRSVKVTYAVGDDERKVRGWVPVRRDREDVDGIRSSYEPVEDVMHDEFKRRVVLAEFEREWKAFRRRYEHLSQFAEIIRRDIGDDAA